MDTTENVQLAPTANVDSQVFTDTANEAASAPAKFNASSDTVIPPVFFTVTSSATEVSPTTVDPNVRFDGVTANVKADATPVPVNPTTCGDPTALSKRRIAALNAPAFTGLSTTENVQLAPTANVDSQVFTDTANEAASAPAKFNASSDTVIPPVFFTVTSSATEVSPTTVDPNVRFDGETATVKADAALTVITSAVEVLGLKCPSPEYFATIVCVPTASLLVVSCTDAAPLTATLPSKLAPSKKLTVPVGSG